MVADKKNFKSQLKDIKITTKSKKVRKEVED